MPGICGGREGSSNEMFRESGPSTGTRRRTSSLLDLGFQCREYCNFTPLPLLANSIVCAEADGPVEGAEVELPADSGRVVLLATAAGAGCDAGAGTAECPKRRQPNGIAMMPIRTKSASRFGFPARTSAHASPMIESLPH